jgi:hypothetical protein
MAFFIIGKFMQEGQAFYIQIKNESGSYVKTNAVYVNLLYVSFKSMGKRASEKKEKG